MNFFHYGYPFPILALKTRPDFFCQRLTLDEVLLSMYKERHD